MKFTTRLILLATRAAATPPAPAQTTKPAPPAPTDKRVLIITIDGARPDVLLRANTPNLRGLAQAGAFTYWARTTAVSVTLPSYASVLTGVQPRVHGVEWNRDLPLTEPVYPRVPTLFELAKAKVPATRLVAGKSKFAAFAKPGTLDWSWFPQGSTTSDYDVATEAVNLLRRHKPQVMFVHLPQVDTVGHAAGWGTEEQLTAMENADALVGRLLAALEEEKLAKDTYVFFTADHGGAGRSHGADDPRSRHVPWIVRGPGVSRNFDLTRSEELTVNTIDTFATACSLLKVPAPGRVEGRVVAEAMDARELLSKRDD